MNQHALMSAFHDELQKIAAVTPVPYYGLEKDAGLRELIRGGALHAGDVDIPMHGLSEWNPLRGLLGRGAGAVEQVAQHAAPAAAETGIPMLSLGQQFAEGNPLAGLGSSLKRSAKAAKGKVPELAPVHSAPSVVSVPELLKARAAAAPVAPTQIMRPPPEVMMAAPPPRVQTIAAAPSLEAVDPRRAALHAAMERYHAAVAGIPKAAEDLSEEARAHISKKNFALTPSQSSTGQAAYPIHSKHQAGVAVGMVGMHGTPKQKEEVYKDVARKYPELAARSEVPALHAKAKEKDSQMGGSGMGMGSAAGGAGPQPRPLPGMAMGGPPGGTGMV